MKTLPCWEPTCSERVQVDRLFCDRHWRMLESDTQRILSRTFRPGEKPSSIFTVTRGRALDEIRAFRLRGHAAPHQGDFQW